MIGSLLYLNTTFNIPAASSSYALHLPDLYTTACISTMKLILQNRANAFSLIALILLLLSIQMSWFSHVATNKSDQALFSFRVSAQMGLPSETKIEPDFKIDLGHLASHPVKVNKSEAKNLARSQVKQLITEL